MDWGDIYTALVEWARTLTSPNGQNSALGVQFERAETRMYQADIRGDLRVTVVQSTGQDFETHTFDAGTDSVIPVAEGPRTLVVEFKVESIHQDPDRTAQNLLGRLRDRALRGSSRDMLHEVGLSVARVEALTPLAFTDANGHTHSVAVLDVTFNAYAVDAAGAESAPYIRSVEVTSELNGAPDGAEWDDEVIGG